MGGANESQRIHQKHIVELYFSILVDLSSESKRNSCWMSDDACPKPHGPSYHMWEVKHPLCEEIWRFYENPERFKKCPET